MKVRKRARQRGQAKRHAYWAGIAGLLANGGSREVLCFADETAKDTRALRRWRGWTAVGVGAHSVIYVSPPEPSIETTAARTVR